MKVKKILIYSGILIVVLIIVYIIIFVYQNYKFKNSYENLIHKTLSKDELLEYKRDIVRCNWNIFNPEFAYISGKIDPDISFHKPPFLLYDLKDSLQFYIGGTTIENITFEKLLEMVKEDCYQFQKDHNWAETWNKPEANTELRWKWSRSETEEEKREEKEKEEQERKAFEKMLKEKGMTEEEYRESQKLTPEEKEFQNKILKEYGF